MALESYRILTTLFCVTSASTGGKGSVAYATLSEYRVLRSGETTQYSFVASVPTRDVYVVRFEVPLPTVLTERPMSDRFGNWGFEDVTQGWPLTTSLPNLEIIKLSTRSLPCIPSCRERRHFSA